jgi:hypothetical protein
MKIHANRNRAIQEVSEFHSLSILECALVDRVATSKEDIKLEDLPAIQLSLFDKHRVNSFHSIDELFEGILRKQYDMDEIIRLTEYGKKIADQIEARLTTLKAIKNNLYLFPEYALNNEVLNDK